MNGVRRAQVQPAEKSPAREGEPLVMKAFRTLLAIAMPTG